jgi:hypothetical protein
METKHFYFYCWQRSRVTTQDMFSSQEKSLMSFLFGNNPILGNCVCVYCNTTTSYSGEFSQTQSVYVILKSTHIFALWLRKEVEVIHLGSESHYMVSILYHEKQTKFWMFKGHSLHTDQPWQVMNASRANMLFTRLSGTGVLKPAACHAHIFFYTIPL